MKVLVVSNCNGQAYHDFLKHFFPQWDVRMVVITQAQQWLREGHEGFVGFLGELDLCFCLPAFLEDGAERRFKPGVTVLKVPGFIYMGTRPDCFWLPDVTSPTGGGILNSRIAVAAYCAGKNPEQTAALFNEDHYERIGYFDEHRHSHDDGCRAFQSLGVDLEALFPTWWAAGDFMYTPNHPVGVVLYDIMRQILASHGMLDGISEADLDHMRGRFDDVLERGIRWPVYPEIAARLNVIDPVTEWRGSMALGKCVAFSLPEMLARSFRTFAGVDDLRARAEQALGPANLPVYAGDAPAEARIDRDLWN